MYDNTYYYLRDYIMPMLTNIYNAITGMRTAMDNFFSNTSNYLFYGVCIGLFALFWFITSKFIQSILYK